MADEMEKPAKLDRTLMEQLMFTTSRASSSSPKIDGKRILLTGDGRGDHALAGLRHEHDVKLDYFQSIRAKHYAISANGNSTTPSCRR
jgi:hypothetical protein